MTTDQIFEDLKLQFKRIENIEKIILEHNKKSIRNFKFHHKALFAAIVFIGVVFLWYGLWTIVSDIPILNNPYVAVGIGLALLFATGKYYNNTL